MDQSDKDLEMKDASRMSPYDIAPLPRAVERGKGTKKRASQSSTILTSTPYKQYIEEQQMSKRAASNEGSRPKRTNKKQCPVSKKLFLAQSPKVKQRKNGKQPLKVGNQPPASTDNTPCCICGKRFNEPPADSWTQCPKCDCWYHDSCGPEDTALCFYCL